MKISKTKVDYVDANNGPYISGATHTIEYEPTYFSSHFRFLEEDSEYIKNNLINVKREAAFKIAEEIIDRMDVRRDTNHEHNTIDYVFTIRALDDKKTRDFENRVNNLEHELNMVKLDNNFLKFNNDDLTKNNSIMKSKINTIENGSIWSKIKFIFGII